MVRTTGGVVPFATLVILNCYFAGFHGNLKFVHNGGRVTFGLNVSGGHHSASHAQISS